MFSQAIFRPAGNLWYSLQKILSDEKYDLIFLWWMCEIISLDQISSFQSLSCVGNLRAMDCSMPGFPFHHKFTDLAQTHVHRVGDAIQPTHPLLSSSPPAFNLSKHQGLSDESVVRIWWPKYWHFSFSISPSNEYSGLISFRIDWIHFFAVQRTLKSLLQHHSLKASSLQR